MYRKLCDAFYTVCSGAAFKRCCKRDVACGMAVMELGPLDYYHFPVDPSKATASICEIG